MKKAIRVLSLILMAMLLLWSLAACGNQNNNGAAASPTSSASSKPSESASNPAEKQQTVTWVCMQDQTGTQEKIVSDFEAQNPNIKIDLQEIPGNSDDVKKGLITSLAAGQDDPDVFNMDVIWTTQFASAGWPMDLTDKIDKDMYMAGPLTTVTYQNKIWAFPMYTNVQLLYYRTDLLSSPPKTWDEMVQMCKDNIGKNGIEYGLLYQAFQGEPIVCNALTFIKSNGGNDIVNGEVVINSENSLEALKFMRQLIDDGLSPEDVLAHKPTDTMAIYEQGKALFMIGWLVGYTQMNNTESSVIKGKFSVTAFPVGPSGTEPGPTVGGWNLAVNALTDVPEAAIKFASYVCGVDGQKTRTLGDATLPTIGSLYNDNEINEKLPILSEITTSVDYAKSRPNAPDYPSMSSLIAVNFHKALSGTISYEEALKTLETGMKELISQ